MNLFLPPKNDLLMRFFKDVSKTYTNIFHWKDTHNQKLMRTLEIFGKAYILNYVDSKGRFSEKILSPKNAICYCDDDGVPVRFIHFYIPKYETTEYHDIYYPDGLIEIYKGNSLIKTRQQPFNGIPVSVCELWHGRTAYAARYHQSDS